MKQLHFSILFCILIVCGVRAVVGGEPPVVVKPSRSDAVYPVGETVEWAVTTSATQPSSARYAIRPFGGAPTADGTIEYIDGRAVIRAAPIGSATLLLEIRGAHTDSKEMVTRAGAVIDPAHINPAAEAPTDFNAFWDKQVEAVSAIPLNPVVSSLHSGRDGVAYELIELDNIAGSKVRGQLARPAREGRYPAMLIVQWAGVYPLQKAWVLDRAAEGWLALNISAHDLPTDRPEDFYKAMSDGALKNYAMIGNQSRDTSYFLRMYHSCHRAVDYLASRPDWDGRTIVVTGTSQGGLLSIITAAMRPEKVTALMANVPAGCDTLSHTAGRATGWPYWYGNARGKADEAAIMNTSRYFDAANFAPRVRCPALVSVGLIDLTCPPAGVIGMFNRLGGSKELIVMPESDHKGTGNTQVKYYERANSWGNALLRSGSPPTTRPATTPDPRTR